VELVGHGARVTVIGARGSRLTLLLGQISYINRSSAGGPYAMISLLRHHTGSLIARPLAAEGKTWIRGHHDESSVEGRALLATAMLLG
jgi:hypothetical protein